MSNKAVHLFARIGATVVLAVMLSACPRMAKVDLYNNTGAKVAVNVGGNIYDIAPDTKMTFAFGSKTMIVESRIGTWEYDRKLVPYRGEEGPYFDGTAYLQLNEDGLIYAVKKGMERPKEAFEEQPMEFPIEPSS